MRKFKWSVLTFLLISNVYAEKIPYCPGTNVTGEKNMALQYVVHQFARENHCQIGNNCLQNFDGIKYSIAWQVACEKSEKKGNSALGSTFICAHGFCYPYGFSTPMASYSH